MPEQCQIKKVKYQRKKKKEWTREGWKEYKIGRREREGMEKQGREEEMKAVGQTEFKGTTNKLRNEAWMKRKECITGSKGRMKKCMK